MIAGKFNKNATPGKSFMGIALAADGQLYEKLRSILR
jgi:hypothetical protein